MKSAASSQCDGDELALVVVEWKDLLDHGAMPLLRYPYLEYDGRKTMRSLADALTKLRELGSLSDSDNVEIKTMGLRLPDGRLSGTVSVLGPHQQDGTRRIILMPSSARFSAKTTLGERRTYAILELDNAKSDSEGNVELADGQFLHAIDLIPAPAHYDLTRTEQLIVVGTILFLKLKKECFRPVDENLAPGVEVLDYAAVAKVRIKRLKPIVQYIKKHLPDVSETIICSALKRAGMQFPRSHTSARNGAAPSLTQSRHI